MNVSAIPIAVLLIALMVGGGYYKGHKSGVKAGQNEVQVKWDAEKQRLEKAAAEEREKARAREIQLQNAADEERRKKDGAIRDLNVRIGKLIDRLHNRPERPADSEQMPQTASAGSDAGGCTGSRLFRQDGQFLAGEAAAGRQCQVFLSECRAAYDNAIKLQSKD